MQKTISSITELKFKENTSGFRTIDIHHGDIQIEPFLVFTEFHMSKPVFGPHPHAGVSVMTYILPDSEGSFINRDSLGDNSIIEPGGLHVTQAGSGVKHDEVPQVNGVDCHGFQIWINHADKDRLVAPKSFHASKNDIGYYQHPNVMIRILQGSYQYMNSRFNLLTATTLLHIQLNPHEATLKLPCKKMSFMYLMSGKIKVNEETIEGKKLIHFKPETLQVEIFCFEKTEFMFATGEPHNEPIVYEGPFVMTTQEQMHETKLRLGRGEMGELEARLIS
jgi:redox-sensitive bicupin YhaK (pirin superfamily)